VTLQNVLAALGFLVCVALLVHHALGARRQARLQAAGRATVARLRLAWLRLRMSGLRLRQGRSDARQASGQAEREAADLIERARRGATGDGKVIRPRQFDRQRKDLH